MSKQLMVGILLVALQQILADPVYAQAAGAVPAGSATDPATGLEPAAAGTVPPVDPMAAGTTDPMAGAMDPNAAMTTETAPATESGAEASATAIAAAEAGKTTVVENPYGFEALWAQGDPIARGTLIILFFMSFFSWYILFLRLWAQRRIFKDARELDQRNFWTASSIKDAVQKLSANNVFRAIAQDGLRAAQHHDGKLTDQIDLHSWVSMSLQRSVESVNSDLQSGLSFLATVGSTAPFVGLFGTVYGIYNALIAIGVAGQASIDRVAGPVGEALIMTAVGLAVAVPAVLAYNWLLRRNKSAIERLRNFSADFHAFLLAGATAKAPAR